MRKLFSVAVLVATLGLVIPAEAQLRSEIPNRQAQAGITNDTGTGFLLNRLFSPDHFRMGHSYEMSFNSFGGGTTTGLYTNSLMWHFNEKFAARVDIGFMHQPFGSNNLNSSFSNQMGGQVFLQNAEFAYRPTENMTLHFSMRQSPYGSYMNPYGYNPYGRRAFGYGYGPHGSGFNASVSTHSGGLFWNPDLR